MTTYLADTDLLADFLNGREQPVQLITSLSEQGIAISIISYAELYEGVVAESHQEHRRNQLEELARIVEVLPVDFDVARLFAEHRAALRQQGLLIPDLDVLIAATALRHDLTLIGRDRHFERIPSLKRL